MNEVELMQRVSSGDTAGIRQLIDSHYDSVFRLLRHLSGSREDAEDMAQDVFLLARTKGDRFTGRGSLRAWLCRIAVNQFGRHIRREKLRRLYRPSFASKRFDVEALIDSEWLLSGLSSLSPIQRSTLLLFDVHGFSVDEIAQMTSSPAGTVKARLHYARKKVHQVLVCPDKEMPNA